MMNRSSSFSSSSSSAPPPLSAAALASSADSSPRSPRSVSRSVGRSVMFVVSEPEPSHRRRRCCRGRCPRTGADCPAATKQCTATRRRRRRRRRRREQPEALVLGCAASHAGVRLGLSGREEWAGAVSQPAAAAVEEPPRQERALRPREETHTAEERRGETPLKERPGERERERKWLVKVETRRWRRRKCHDVAETMMMVEEEEEEEEEDTGTSSQT
ncbi:hypothetical protein INR49_009075 [Caranx melampygus]|nr:hypothetical protein INR49_009075 [Caranx melampygus]